MLIENEEFFAVPTPLTVWTTEGDPSHAQVIDGELHRRGGLVRQIHGSRIVNDRDLLTVFAAAFQFPYYFGFNSGALDECLADLDWLPAPEFIVLSIYEPEMLLRESAEDHAWFVRRMRFAQSEWAHTSELGYGSDRRSTPFQIILHCSSDASSEETTWSSAGAIVKKLN